MMGVMMTMVIMMGGDGDFVKSALFPALSNSKSKAREITHLEDSLMLILSVNFR